MTIKISKEDYDEIQRLYREAQNAPVVKLFGMVDLNKEAWQRVQEYMDMLGKKYGYNPHKNAINSKQEVVPYERPREEE